MKSKEELKLKDFGNAFKMSILSRIKEKTERELLQKQIAPHEDFDGKFWEFIDQNCNSFTFGNDYSRGQSTVIDNWYDEVAVKLFSKIEDCGSYHSEDFSMNGVYLTIDWFFGNRNRYSNRPDLTYFRSDLSRWLAFNLWEDLNDHLGLPNGNFEKHYSEVWFGFNYLSKKTPCVPLDKVLDELKSAGYIKDSEKCFSHLIEKKITPEVFSKFGQISACLYTKGWDYSEIFIGGRPGSFFSSQSKKNDITVYNPIDDTPIRTWYLIDKDENDKNILLNSNFRNKFRAAALDSDAGNAAHADLAIADDRTDLIINQYIHNHMTPAEAVIAYNNGWIYGVEVGFDDAAHTNCQISIDGGANYVDYDWTANARGVAIANGVNIGVVALNAFDVAKVNAYQTDVTNARWNPALDNAEKGLITAAMDAPTLTAAQHNIAKARFVAEFRAAAVKGTDAANIPNDADGTFTIGQLYGKNLTALQAITAFNFANFFADFRNDFRAVGVNAADPVLANDFVIDQFNHDDITGTEAGTAFNNSWIYGLELSQTGVGLHNQVKMLGVEIIGDYDWVAKRRDESVIIDAVSGKDKLITAFDVAKINAYQLNDLVKRWNPALDKTECGQISKATDVNEVKTAQQEIRNAREGLAKVAFHKAFRTEVDVAGVDSAASKAFGATANPIKNSDLIIDQFNERGITAKQAVTAYNNGWTNPAEIKITDAGVVQGSVDGGTTWLTTVDPTVTKRADAFSADFLRDFRSIVGNSSVKAGKAGYISDDDVAKYQKVVSPNNTYRLTGKEAAAAYNNNWTNYKEIQITDFRAIEASLDGKKWLTSIDPTKKTRADAICSVWRTAFAAETAVGPRITSFNGTGSKEADNTIMDAWFDLTVAGGGEIPNDKLTAANARILYSNNWDAADITAGINVLRATHPNGTTVDTFDKIKALGDKNVLAWRATMTATKTDLGPRNTNPNDTIMDDWFNLTAAGGGRIADANLTAANARVLYSKNWDSSDIKEAKSRFALVLVGNNYDIRVVRPDTKVNVEGYTNINDLGDKVDLLWITFFTTDAAHINVFGNATAAPLTPAQTAARAAWQATDLSARPGSGVARLLTTQAQDVWAKNWSNLRIGAGAGHNATDGTGAITLLNLGTHTFSYQSHNQPIITNIDPTLHNKTHLDAYNALSARIGGATQVHLEEAAAVGNIRQAIADFDAANPHLPAANNAAALDTLRTTRITALTTGTPAEWITFFTTDAAHINVFGNVTAAPLTAPQNDARTAWKALGLSAAPGTGTGGATSTQVGDMWARNWRQLQSAPTGAANVDGQITSINPTTHTFTYASHGQTAIANINPLTHDKNSLDTFNALQAKIKTANATELQATGPGSIQQAITDLGTIHNATLPTAAQSTHLNTARNDRVVALDSVLTAAKDTAKGDIETDMKATATATEKPISSDELAAQFETDNPKITGTWQDYLKNAATLVGDGDDTLETRKKKVLDSVKKARITKGQKPVPKLTDEKLQTYLNTVAKPEAPVVEGWKVILDNSQNQTEAKVKTEADISKFKKEFIVGNEKAIFEKIKEMSDANKPAGNVAEVAVDNLLATKKPEEALPVIFKGAVENVTIYNKYAKEMTELKDNDGRSLDPAKYPQDNSVANYLTEVYQGKTPTYKQKDHQQVRTEGHLQKYWPLYAVGSVVTIAGVGAIIFWENIMNWWNSSGEKTQVEKE